MLSTWTRFVCVVCAPLHLGVVQSRGKRGGVQVEHIRLTLVLKSTWFVNQLKVHPFSKFWFQIANLHPLHRGCPPLAHLHHQPEVAGGVRGKA